MPTWADYVKEPFTHPHYPEYTNRCQAAGLDKYFTAWSWYTLIKGLEKQAELKRNGTPRAPNPWLLAFGTLIAANARIIMLPQKVSPQTRMALWSGGISVSQHVRKQGYETLESTLYGGILDKMTNPTFKIWLGDKSWGPQGKVWNVISAEFVKVVAKDWDTMHVFMRTHDLDSVFYTEERVNWRAAKGKRANEEDGLTYHILIGMDSFKTEKVFYSEKTATQYLLRYLHQTSIEYRDRMLRTDARLNYRLRSETWVDNQRSFADSFKAKDGKQSYDDYIGDAVREAVADFATDSKAMEAASAKDFSPDKFAGVMGELLKKVKRID